MVSTDEILQAARALGEKISQHEAAKKFEAVITRLQEDRDAQRLLTDYNRHLQTLSEKEMHQQPIEVADKARLQELQKQVVTHPVLRDLQVAQMDYLDLMRKVDEAMTGEAPAGAGPAAMDMPGPGGVPGGPLGGLGGLTT